MWVKVCGIRDPLTVTELTRLPKTGRPDAIGLNFYPNSPRFIDRETAAAVVAELDGAIEAVGLFVNAAIEQIVAIQRELRLPRLQLHGDESPEFLSELGQACPGVALIRAMRVSEKGVEEISEYFRRCSELDAIPDACLVDARVPGSYGGTGQSPPWSLLAGEYRFESWPPLVLAGGLEPGNVLQAIETVRPFGVDVASGVETNEGVKDIKAVSRFVENARAAADRREG